MVKTLSYSSNGFESSSTHDNNGSAVYSDRQLKKAIWIYFFLLIFEGALRKWFLPGLAAPLLIIRDPVAIWVLGKVFFRGQFPSNIYLNGTIFIGIIAILTAILFGHGNLPVALFGARILLIHFPLTFVIGRIFSQADVIKIGKVSIWIAIPMTLLIALQFYSPQSDWVNRGVGGDMEGAGFSGAMGYFRPPGTFSFITGLVAFYTFVAPFILFFWIKPEGISKIILIAATIGLLASIPLSISRTLFFSIGVVLLFLLIAVSRQPKNLGRVIVASIILIIVVALLSQISLFQIATEAFTTRFENANETEGGLEGVLVDRYLGGLIGALIGGNEIPFFGYGLGMGTNVGSMLLTGNISFLISEGEWGRLVGELGTLMGLAFIMIRVSFSFSISVAAYKALVKGNLLPWLLLSFGLLIIPQGQWAQPTNLGFSTLIGGLILASFRKSYTTTNKSQYK